MMNFCVPRFVSFQNNAASLPFFTGRRKGKNAAGANNPIGDSGLVVASASTEPIEKALARVSLSRTNSDMFTGTAKPSIIRELIDKIRSSAAFKKANRKFTTPGKGIFSSAEIFANQPKKPEAEKLEAVYTHALDVFKRFKKKGELVQFLKTMGLVVLDSSKEPWVKTYFDKLNTMALFILPYSLWGFEPSWQPKKRHDLDAITPEYAEMSSKLHEEKSPAILMSSHPNDERVAVSGQNSAKHDAQHETMHYLQYMMGIPLRSHNREATVIAKGVEKEFLSDLVKLNSNNPQVREQVLKKIEKELGEVLVLAHQQIEKMEALEDEHKTSAMSGMAGLFRMLSKGPDLKPEEFEAAREHYFQHMDRQEELERLKALSQSLSDIRHFSSFSDETTLETLRSLMSNVNLSSKSQKDNGSVGAAVRIIARRELEVYDFLIRHKMDIYDMEPDGRSGQRLKPEEQKYHLFNLQQWFVYKLLEQYSHRFDRDIPSEHSA